MTPQLQQAIKLSQLSRMEPFDMVRDEMLENPILRTRSIGQRAGKPPMRPPGDGNGARVERVGETETPIVEIRRIRSPRRRGQGGPNPTRRSTTSTGGIPGQPGGGRADAVPQVEQRRSSVAGATLTRGTSSRPPEWQLKLSHFTLEEDGIAMLIIGNLTLTDTWKIR
jgi:RNA polymerase sigma-54 factor